MDPRDLYRNPNALAPHYAGFRVAERLLLTGHSHQAWPDCCREAQTQAWLDAAAHVDDKWSLAFAKADEVRAGFARLLDDKDGEIALGSNTHELMTRFFSALPLGKRPKIITTDGEFHSLRRQLDRLAEESVEVVKVPSRPAQSVAERMAVLVDDRTAAVALSHVFFDSGRIVGDLSPLVAACGRHGAEILVDAYHALNVIPFSVKSLGLQDAFVVGGGYKYCQLGEGNCFLRFPAACRLRPVITGWFAEFDQIGTAPGDRRVPYGRGHHRFAGSTYDPVSHYRAAAVFDFFRKQRLTPAFLREVSQHRVGLLARTFDELDLPPEVVTRDRTVPLEQLGGFLVLESERASDLCSRLKELDVHTDSRGNSLRFGPAPYLSDDQLVDAMTRLGSAVGSL
ncbi:MAG: aminotransferase class V-fold PLP-dependent enzyme [Planctomycetota bacterium]